VHDVIDAINAVAPEWEIVGYVDDAPTESNRMLVLGRGYTVLGPVEALAEMAGMKAVIGIASSSARRTIDARLHEWNIASATLVHPTATLGHAVTLGDGSVVCAGARLTTNIKLGRHVHVDQNATIGHDTSIGAYSRLNPQACVSGSVTIGPDCLVGASATILEGRTIGSDATVGAGSLVARDVAPGATVKGIPAK
jgi:sugar O-acyltransferase (sialic acid O-acetyltransferase NeuD family)